MMKWLLLSLLSINLILFMVHFKQQDSLPAVYNKKEGVAEIVLLSESVPDGGARPERCYVIEGFESEMALEPIKKYLSERGVVFHQIVRPEFKASVYRVYAKEQKDSELKALQQRLNNRGIESYVVADGELKGMLSVGLFENIDLAKSLVNKLKEQGVDADFYERKKTKNYFSIELERNQIKDEGAFLQGLRGSMINNAEIKEFFCKGIASEK